MYINFFTLYLQQRDNSNIILTNETKFLNVVKFWFEYFDYTNDFILNTNKDIHLLNNNLIRKSILHSLDVYEEKQNIHCHEKNKFYEKILALFLTGKKGYLPAGVSNRIYDKVKFKLLSCKVKDLKIKIDNDFKSKYLKECSKFFDPEIVNVLKDIIPDAFFSYGLISEKNLPYILKGSPLCFFDFYYNYLKLLLQTKKVKIIGIQHGGAYGEWQNNPYENYEKRISDIYYGWGFFEHNIIQNRFKKNKIKLSSFRNGIFWFGRDESYLPQNLSFANEYLEHNKLVDHVEFFYNFFKKFNFSFLPHPRISHSIYKLIDKSFYLFTNDNVNYILNAKLVIFDCLSHTLMYHCLFNKIPFVIVLDKWPVDNLTINAFEFYNILFENNIILYKDDAGIMNKLEVLTKYINENKEDFFSADLINYVESNFFSHTTIDKL